MKTNKDIGNELEKYVVALLEEIDPRIRQSKGSGNSKEKGDIYNFLKLKIECKNRNTDNCIINRKVWNKLLKELNVYNQETPVLILRNKHNETFACLNIKDFINLLKNKEK